MPGNYRTGGRNKKPTALKLLQGTYRPGRHGREPKAPRPGWPRPPAWLTIRERTLWRALKRHCGAWSAPSDGLAYNGVVSLMDRLLRVQEAMQETATAGSPVHLTADGAEARANVLYGLEVKLWRELRAYIGLCGLSPVDRARMHIEDERKPPSPLDRFLKKGPA